MKLTAAAISSQRWLLTFPQECLASQSGDRALASAVDFLGVDLSLLRAEIPHPVALHLGCDGTGGDAVRKLYFEAAEGHAGMVFLALKVRHGRAVLHRYTAVVAQDALPQLRLPEPLHSACLDLLSVLPRNMPALLVQPDIGWRRSLDINLSDLADTPEISACVAALIERVCPGFDHGVRTPMSHIAVGMADDTAPFVTLYGYPEWIHPDKDAAPR